MRLLLASTSPYRRALLQRLRLPFDTVKPQVDEAPLTGEEPAALVQRLAQAKAAAARALKLGKRFFGGRAADFGPRARAQPLGDFRAELNAMIRRRAVQRLRIRVRNDEIDALDLGRDHIGDRIASGAAHTDDGDARTQLFN